MAETTLISKVSALATRVGQELCGLRSGGLWSSVGFTLDESVPEGGTVSLPGGVAYVPGEDAVVMFWNGLACVKGQSYEEAEAGADGTATTVTLLFDSSAGDEFLFLVRC